MWSELFCCFKIHKESAEIQGSQQRCASCVTALYSPSCCLQYIKQIGVAQFRKHLMQVIIFAHKKSSLKRLIPAAQFVFTLNPERSLGSIQTVILDQDI